MKNILFVLALIMPLIAFANPAKLSGGTPVQIKTSLPAKSNQITTDIQGVVDANVYAADGKTILIQKGAPVKIHTMMIKNGAAGKAGKILINGASALSVDGKTIPLSTQNMEIKGNGRGGLAHGLSWGLAIPTSFLSCFCLFIKGSEAEIPAGTIIPNTIVEGNHTITID